MKSIHLLVFGLFLFVSTFAQQIRYDVSAPNAVHHEAEITVTVTGLPAAPALFRMSRSSPGRYATHEFGKNVYNVRAVDQNGTALPLAKTDADVYQVAGHKGTVKLQYTLFGNYADGTYAEIDETHLHLNMPASLLWVKGLENVPVTVHFNLPDSGWTIATQLKPTSDPTTFTAPGLQYLMDSPTRAGKQSFRQWMVANPDRKTYTFRLALEAEGTEPAIDSFASNVQRIVEEAKAVFGEVPAYDYGTYTFIAGINPYVKGDGMEHRNSTMITIPVPFSNNTRLLGVFAHEFFHCWNVERIRPKSLEPFNFEKSNMSEALWIAEGFTQYYGNLLIRRAGLGSEEMFLQQVAGLINAKENTAGGTLYTPVENSQRAVFVDAGVAVDRTNYPNMYTSYYAYGGALALALDLQLRTQFNQSLDRLMQEFWQQFGRTGKAYTLPDVQKALAAISTPAFAHDFFQRQVYGHDPVDYASLLKAAGYGLVKAAPGKAWIGSLRQLTQEAGGLTVNGATQRQTPLYTAGLDDGDQLLQLDNKEVKTIADVETILLQHKPGENLPLTFRHRGVQKQATIKLQENPSLTLLPAEAGKAAEQAFRQNWLGSKVKTLP